MMTRHSFAWPKFLLGLLVVLSVSAVPLIADGDGSILNKLKTIKTISPTVPANGDINPYGLVRVPRTIGNLQEGHYLVSNFNASSNSQGTGTTIVDVSPGGALSLFAQIDPTKLPGAGTLFGVLFDPEVGLVFVDDGSNTLNVLQ
jgi:hypothetical protein